MNFEKIKEIPKAYFVLIAMAIVVFGILIFGGGGVALQSKDLTTIEFKLYSYEELINEDGQSESIILTTKDYKAKVSIDPIEINDLDRFIATIKNSSPNVKVSILKSDTDLLIKDEIIQAYSIEINGENFISDGER